MMHKTQRLLELRSGLSGPGNLMGCINTECQKPAKDRRVLGLHSIMGQASINRKYANSLRHTESAF